MEGTFSSPKNQGSYSHQHHSYGQSSTNLSSNHDNEQQLFPTIRKLLLNSGNKTSSLRSENETKDPNLRKRRNPQISNYEDQTPAKKAKNQKKIRNNTRNAVDPANSQELNTTKNSQNASQFQGSIAESPETFLDFNELFVYLQKTPEPNINSELGSYIERSTATSNDLDDIIINPLDDQTEFQTDQSAQYSQENMDKVDRTFVSNNQQSFVQYPPNSQFASYGYPLPYPPQQLSYIPHSSQLTLESNASNKNLYQTPQPYTSAYSGISDMYWQISTNEANDRSYQRNYQYPNNPNIFHNSGYVQSFVPRSPAATLEKWTISSKSQGKYLEFIKDKKIQEDIQKLSQDIQKHKFWQLCFYKLDIDVRIKTALFPNENLLSELRDLLKKHEENQRNATKDEKEIFRRINARIDNSYREGAYQISQLVKKEKNLFSFIFKTNITNFQKGLMNKIEDLNPVITSLIAFFRHLH